MSAGQGNQPRRTTKVALITGAAAVVVAGAGIGAYAMVSGGKDDTAAEEQVKTGPPTADEVRETTDAFLTAWAKGDAAGAAAHTDDSAAAEAALTAYREKAHITKVKLAPSEGEGEEAEDKQVEVEGEDEGEEAGAKVPFAVAATVSYDGKSKPFAYDSELTVVREPKDGRTVVDWTPSVVHPDLREGDELRTSETDTPPIKALDRDGDELTAEKFPSLVNVLASLRQKYGDKAGGKPGVELQVVRGKSAAEDEDAKSTTDTDTDTDTDSDTDSAAADELPDKTLLPVTKGTPGTLKTTISATSQAAAEKEAKKHQRAAVVVLKPSTGEIMAVANSRPAGFNVAFQGSLAPGSTMKIVSASLLLEKDLAGVDKQHPCPKYSSYGGWKFQNLEKFKIDNGTFRQSFAASCNTAFISQAEELPDDALTQHAQQVYGLGKDDWATGVSTFDGAVPVQKDAPKAASLIGQGGVRMNPLNVASFLATAKTGTFKQPYLVDASVDNRTFATAPRKMSAATHDALVQLLRTTATSGSAAPAMAGLGSDIGGKTGSAEVDGQKKPNGWFTGWHGDLAAAAVIQEGGRGGESAGPVVREVLRAGS
ncbi:penicillin-binding transpeptidase domain-containing protein [Streptomyces apocyni]|uniref:penicillin-binding transpeptidase domain-containing protein n=1 Tax=Streptomyces apocyni TaxID=2654677 RepID=UPI0012EAF392|nr:penicillin-binding transpeptidase domain-containing protein [Streptomyces apocyni]